MRFAAVPDWQLDLCTKVAEITATMRGKASRHASTEGGRVRPKVYPSTGIYLSEGRNCHSGQLKLCALKVYFLDPLTWVKRTRSKPKHRR